MENRRLFQLLALLTEEETQEFKEFLQSPLFAPSKRLSQFFQKWESRVQKSESPDQVTPESLLEGTKLQPARLDKYCSQLTRRLLDFLDFKEYWKNKAESDSRILSALESRKAPESELERQHRLLRKTLKKQPESAEKVFSVLKTDWLTLEKQVNLRKPLTEWEVGLGDLNRSLDEFYLLQKLKLSVAAVNARKILRAETFAELDEEFLETVRQKFPLREHPPLIRAYFHCLEMLDKEEGAAHFEALVEILGKYSGGFIKRATEELYSYALNFCIGKANQGELQYRSHSAALYRQLIENGLLLQKGKISAQAMKNIVVIHCVLGETDWVKSFLERFRGKIIDDVSGQTITYNQAILAFYSQDYAQAISLLSGMLSQLKSDVFFELDARVYLWKSYFEHLEHLSAEEVDHMFRMYDSFRIFINRNQKISEAHKQQYRNFIRQFRKFMVLLEKEPLPVDSLQELEQEVREVEFMANKGWFLEKINEALVRS